MCWRRFGRSGRGRGCSVEVRGGECQCYFVLRERDVSMAGELGLGG